MAFFKDIFYPGNPERRNKVQRKYQQVLGCMKDNFYATNKLSDYLKRNFNVKTPAGRVVHTVKQVSVKNGLTIKENCDIFLKEVDKLQIAVALLDSQLAEKLDPIAYQTLHDTSLSYIHKIRKASQWTSIVTELGAGASAVAVICHVVAGGMLTATVAEIGLLATCTIAGVVVAATGIVFDMIFSAIYGAIERDKLENTIADLDKTLATFEPATRKYTMTIFEVLAQLNIGGHS